MKSLKKSYATDAKNVLNDPNSNLKKDEVKPSNHTEIIVTPNDKIKAQESSLLFKREKEEAEEMDRLIRESFAEDDLINYRSRNW